MVTDWNLNTGSYVTTSSLWARAHQRLKLITFYSRFLVAAIEVKHLFLFKVGIEGGAEI